MISTINSKLTQCPQCPYPYTSTHDYRCSSLTGQVNGKLSHTMTRTTGSIQESPLLKQFSVLPCIRIRGSHVRVWLYERNGFGLLVQEGLAGTLSLYHLCCDREPPIISLKDLKWGADHAGQLGWEGDGLLGPISMTGDMGGVRDHNLKGG